VRKYLSNAKIIKRKNDIEEEDLFRMPKRKQKQEDENFIMQKDALINETLQMLDLVKIEEKLEWNKIKSNWNKLFPDYGKTVEKLNVDFY
jgi:hypothetical protein